MQDKRCPRKAANRTLRPAAPIVAPWRRSSTVTEWLFYNQCRVESSTYAGLRSAQPRRSANERTNAEHSLGERQGSAKRAEWGNVTACVAKLAARQGVNAPRKPDAHHCS